jgi:hypothetical protein
MRLASVQQPVHVKAFQTSLCDLPFRVIKCWQPQAVSDVVMTAVHCAGGIQVHPFRLQVRP